jgi:nucleoside-diphosphate kinase
MANNNERTYIMIKPDGVQRGLVGEIIKRFEQRGYHLAALKMIQVIFLISILYIHSHINCF